MGRPRALMSWSSGKDSAFALHEARRSGEVEIVGLLTTVSEAYGRVAMHGVREALLEQQAARLGLPLTRVALPSPCPNDIYEARMAEAMAAAQADGIHHVVFGDLYLEDIRRYREEKLAQVGMTALFPLWGRDTAALAAEMIDSGLRAVLTCADPKQVPADFAGRWFDRELLAALPDGADPCGENGEFHTLCTAGPMFDAAIPVTVGERVMRDGFSFAEVRPV
ncbi:MAG TPA: ATP-binding protein [Alphaproteobacteria bacterium]|nr:ATP-binding protein [Alphaproteobacteria bacterium]